MVAPDKPYHIISTSLDPADTARLEKFAAMFSTLPPPVAAGNSNSAAAAAAAAAATATATDATSQSVVVGDTFDTHSVVVGDTFDASVTHVVVSVDKAGALKKRTMKFMQAVMGGLWVLSARWLTDSLVARRLLPEDGYEVPGFAKMCTTDAPRRARLALAAPVAPVQAPTQAPTQGAVQGATDGHVNTHEDEDEDKEEVLTFAAAPGFYMPRKPGNCLFQRRLIVLVGNFATPGPPRAQLAALLGAGQGCVTTALADFMRAAARRRDRAQVRPCLAPV